MTQRQQRAIPMSNHVREVAHEYRDVSDKGEKCRTNLAVRLYTQIKASEGWKRWAVATGNNDLIAAVNEAVKALKKAHKIAAPKEYTSRKAKGEADDE